MKDYFLIVGALAVIGMSDNAVASFRSLNCSTSDGSIVYHNFRGVKPPEENEWLMKGKKIELISEMKELAERVVLESKSNNIQASETYAVKLELVFKIPEPAIEPLSVTRFFICTRAGGI